MAVTRIELSADLMLYSWDAVVRYVLENISIDVNGERVRGITRVLQAIGLSGKADLNRLRSTTLPHTGFRNAMVYAVSNGSVGMHLARFLQGQRVGIKMLESESVYRVKEPLTRSNAEFVLQTITGGLFALGVPGTMLLFDETERTFQSATYTQRARAYSTANLMRRMIDSATTDRLIGTIAVFAVLPDFIVDAGSTYAALGQRLDRSYEFAPPVWRQPVLQISEVSSTPDPVDFLTLLVDRFVDLIDRAGGSSADIRERLTAYGGEVLQQQAGSGYRRDLLKRLAMTSLRFL